MVDELPPPQCSVLLAGYGGGPLPQLGNRTILPFPPGPGEPTSSLAAIANLSVLRAEGANYLMLLGPAVQWLEQHDEWGHHLSEQFRQMPVRDETCRMYALDLPPQDPAGDLVSDLRRIIEDVREELGREPSILDWNTEAALDMRFPDRVVFHPVFPDFVLPYLDDTIDIVVFRGDMTQSLEAQRVAHVAAVHIVGPLQRDPTEGKALTVHRRTVATPEPPQRVSMIVAGSEAGGVDGCFTSLAETLPSHFGGQVILVGDVTTAAEARAAEHFHGRLTRIAFRDASGRATAWRRGAEQAAGDIYVFLVWDVVLLPHWLPMLLDTFHRHPEAGVVVGKVVTRDGALWEAGMVCDGIHVPLGKGEDAQSPAHTLVRQVDGCSGAFLATRRSTYEMAGGFGPDAEEPFAFCDRVRDGGQSTIFQPEIVTVWLGAPEHTTSPRAALCNT